MTSFRVLVIAVMVVMPACKDQPAAAAAAPQQKEQEVKPAAPAAAPVDDKAAAEEIFATRCTPCHGAKGQGDGAASATLTPKPRDLTDPKWHTEVTDDHIEKIVLYGGAAVNKSPAMPSNPDLDSKPSVVKALRAHIRSLKK